MLKRIAEAIRRYQWFAVVIEIGVIIVGLLLALQLDRWREAGTEREREQAYIERLAADVAADIPDIEYAIELQTLRLDLINLLMAVAANPERAAENPVLFVGAVNQAAYTYTPTLTSHTFENLRATGDLRLILSQAVKDDLFRYYGYDEEQRQYRSLQFDTEFRHFELAAGVLSPELEVAAQDEWLFFRPGTIDAALQIQLESEQVMAAARRLQEREDLVAWLPYVRGMQLEQIDVHQDRLRLARAALETLTDYSHSIGREQAMEAE